VIVICPPSWVGLCRRSIGGVASCGSLARSKEEAVGHSGSQCFLRLILLLFGGIPNSPAHSQGILTI